MFIKEDTGLSEFKRYVLFLMVFHRWFDTGEDDSEIERVLDLTEIITIGQWLPSLANQGKILICWVCYECLPRSQSGWNVAQVESFDLSQE